MPWRAERGAASATVMVVSMRLGPSVDPRAPLTTVIGPLEAAARALAAAGAEVETMTLEPASSGAANGEERADGPAIRRRGFSGETGRLLSTLKAELDSGRVTRVLAGPVEDQLCRDAVALAPGLSCLWCGLTAPPDRSDAALAETMRRVNALLYGSEAEKRAIVEAYGAGLSRDKLEAPALYGMAPRGAPDAPAPRFGGHPYLAHLGPLDDGPLRAWFPRLRDAAAFSQGPIDLYLLDEETEPDSVGVRTVGALEPGARARLLREAVAVVDLGLDRAATLRLLDCWRLGAAVITSTENWSSGPEMTAAEGGAAVSDFESFHTAVTRLRTDATRAQAACAGRERAARLTDPDRFQQALLHMLEI